MATVLVVDDELAIVELLVELVEDAGHQAIMGRNGHEALELAQQYLPVLIISDIMMPIMDGYDLLMALRNDPALENIMVVLISANSLRKDIHLDTSTTFIAKPLDLARIERFLAVL